MQKTVLCINLSAIFWGELYVIQTTLDSLLYSWNVFNHEYYYI